MTTVPSIVPPCPLQVLLDIAHGIQHLHSLKLVHCDIKPENILLQQCSSSPAKGFVAKLSDFGLMKTMHADTLGLYNKSVSGTLTHLAPERLVVSGAVLAVGMENVRVVAWSAKVIVAQSSERSLLGRTQQYRATRHSALLSLPPRVPRRVVSDFITLFPCQ